MKIISELGDDLTLRELFALRPGSLVRALKLIEGIRPELIFAAIIAEEKLRLNDFKPPFSDYSNYHLYTELCGEFSELTYEVDTQLRVNDIEINDLVLTDEIESELADNINYCAFLIAQKNGIPCSRGAGNVATGKNTDQESKS